MVFPFMRLDIKKLIHKILISFDDAGFWKHICPTKKEMHTVEFSCFPSSIK